MQGLRGMNGQVEFRELAFGCDRNIGQERSSARLGSPGQMLSIRGRSQNCSLRAVGSETSHVGMERD